MSTPKNTSRASERGKTKAKPQNGFLREFSNIFSEASETLHDRTQRMDIALLILIGILVVLGTVMMYSASYAYAFYKRDGDSLFFLKKQVLFVSIGTVLMLAASYVRVEHLRRFTGIFLIVTTVMLCLVFLFEPRNDAHRWMFGFQPSELTKFAIILFCASWADANAKRMHTIKYGILPFAIVFGVTAVLLLLEPHISCTVIVALLMLTIMVVGGMDLRWLAGLGGVAAAGVLVLMTCRKALMETSLGQRIYSRVDVWRNPFADTRDSGWQTIQALYAISSGGLTGQGLGNSRQKYMYVSEPQNDFIFSIVCEELGFVGAVIIIVLFMMFVWRGFMVSASNPDRFSKLLGIGITAQVGWQALLNVMVVTNTAPNTGISLPFFSYGGSSLIVLMVEMGVLLSISRQSTLKKI